MLFYDTEDQELLEGSFGCEEDGMRLDAALARHFDSLSRNRAQTLIDGGDVKLNGETELSKKRAVRAGDSVSALIAIKIPLDVKPENIPIDIVYEDEDLLVVNKARGMVVHPGAGNETHTLVNALLWHIGNAGGLSSINGELRPGIVHRIDKNTSGLLVVAKNDMAHRGLSGQFAKHTILREYSALVRGNITDGSGTVDAPIGRDPRNRKRQKVFTDGKGRRAVTHYRVEERLDDSCLLSVALETGRTHQIRVHMAYIGHPVLGDDMYYGGYDSGEGQILHAKTLGFSHPATGDDMYFESRLPEYFMEALVSRRRSCYG